jgi:type I restriction enzyme S subunit|tara:strand:+ start:155644 stop:156966 length:1323 start_codon:yes stop_codon:yes gene_type:complete
MVETETKVERYESYKDSGVEWLGDIPEHWEALANKFVFNLKKNQVGKKSADYDLLSLTLKGIMIRNLENGGKFPAEFDTYQEVKKGDFVFCLFDVEETPRCVGLSDYNGMITGAYTIMEPNENFDRSFLYYFYLNLDADKRMKPLYTGLRNTISKDNFFAFKTFVPPLSEQTAIAQFLDDKTTKIDEAIVIKQQQISLLKERKQILIHKAVTQGLNPNVKLKDSGVDWIGEIPESWNCIKFKFIIRTKARLGWKGLKAAEYVDRSNYGFLSTPNIKTRDIDFDSAYFITQRRYYESPEIMLQKGDVLLVKDGSTLGISNIVRDLPFKCTVNSSIAVLRVMEGVNLLPEYLNYFLKSETCQRIIDKKKDGMGVPHLFQSDINNFSVPIFPIEEQRQISNYIEKSSIKLDEAINLKQQEIEKLKEYKSSLINGVVTGKVKVC